MFQVVVQNGFHSSNVLDDLAPIVCYKERYLGFVRPRPRGSRDHVSHRRDSVDTAKSSARAADFADAQDCDLLSQSLKWEPIDDRLLKSEFLSIYES